MRRISFDWAVLAITAGAAFMALKSPAFLAQAQTPAPASGPAPAAESPADAAARSAFQALAETDRKAIQDALVWTGDYAGISDGTFGKGTLAAIKAYQLRNKAKNDGILAPPMKSALLSEGAKARQAMGFATVDDQKTGVRIGVPLKLLDQRAVGKLGNIFKAKDGSASLEIVTGDAPQSTLADLFAHVIADPTRHVTYKILRPEFYVVSGDIGPRRFFSRFALGQPGIRGFVFTYPAQPGLDRVGVAIADSFVPFPAATPIPTATAPAVSGSTPAPPPIPKSIARLTAIAIGSRQVLSAAPPEDCTAPSIGASTAKIVRADPAAGLVLLERSVADSTAPVILRGPDLQPSETVIVLSATGDGEANVSVASGEAPSPSLLLAPLQSPSGSVVFDRSGALAGLVTFQAVVKRLPGGVVPAASYPMVPPSKLKEFLTTAGQQIKSTDQGAGEASAGTVAAKYGRALVTVSCGG
jgi:peptidoglycan hydrolase-like protein with peptidoglycan-binding domain